MLKASFIYLLLVFCGPTALAESQIYKLCPNTRKLDVVQTPNDLEKSICKIRQSNIGDDKILNLTGSILQTLGRLQNTQTEDFREWQKDSILNYDMEKLSVRLQAINHSESTSKTTTHLQKALNNLKEKWSDVTIRTRPENRDKYIEDIKSTLALTHTGKGILDCYNKVKGPMISGEEFIEITDELKATGAQMAYEPVADPVNEGKFIKRLYFNSHIDPFEAISLLGHELQHGCNTNEQINLKHSHSKLETNSSDRQDFAKKEAEILEKIDQDNAVDEMRAYKVTSDIFKDMAISSPELVCNIKSKSVLFGKQVLNYAEYAASIEDRIQDGSFPLYLISKYAAHGFYDPEHVLAKDENGNITNKLKPELLKKLKDEKVYIAP